MAPAILGAERYVPSPESTPAPGLWREEIPVPERRAGESPLRGMRLYVDPSSAARRALESFEGSAADRARLAYVASQPTAHWFDGRAERVALEVDRLMDAAARAEGLPVLVAANIPNRECDPRYAGGMQGADAYRDWIRDLALGIGDRAAAVVLEPDALGLVSCLTHEGRSERFSLLREAVRVLKNRTRALVYIDAGHALRVDAEEMAQRLLLAGVERADGFALNVANFVCTERSLSYGEQLSRRLGGAHFVIDTSRNGARVRPGEWCNPRGAALGPEPTTDTGHPLADAFLWVKPPGESDGRCNGGPDAGEWYGAYAIELARAAGVRAPQTQA